MKVVALGKISFSDRKNPDAVFNTLAVVEKHFLLTRDNLMQTIQIKLTQNKTFSQFFFAFLKSILNFKHLPKKHDPHS